MKILKSAIAIIFICVFVLSTSSCTKTISEELEANADIVVDINGSGDYITVQEALDAVPDNNDQSLVILVKKGMYREKVRLSHKKTNVILVGEDVDSTTITWDDYGNKMLVNGDPAIGGHTFSTYTFRADADGFQAYNINFNNSTTKGQGVAFHSNGDKQILYHCRLTGNQDTYFDNFRTRRFIKDCYISGTTDFIFGFGVTLFDSCQIHSKRSSYITASSTPQHYKFGHVLKNCFITREQHNDSIYLGRPWFPYSNTVFYECYLPAGIVKEGWGGWSDRQETCFYREYNNYGPGSDTTERVDFGKQLTSKQAVEYTMKNIFGAANFPSDMGEDADSVEIHSLRERFRNSGYVARADTILFAGRGVYPTYPSDDWLPEFNSKIKNIIDKFTTPFINEIDE